jgi:GDP-L-fucose synthase
LFSDDMADACLYMMERTDPSALGELINIGVGDDITIREAAELVADVVGFKGRLVFDSTKPDGTSRKLLDVSRLRDLGWQARTTLRDGLAASYADYISRLSERSSSIAPGKQAITE